jgi:hypothetical protein
MSEETLEFMDSLMPLEIWQAEYSVYEVGFALSRYTYSEIYRERVRPRSNQEGFTSEVFSHYLDTFKREPLMLIKNRLANTNLLWGITEPIGSNTERMATSTRSAEIGFERGENTITVFLRSFAYPVSYGFAPLDIILYRSGIYIILSLMLCVFLVARKSFKVSIQLLPMLGGIIALLIAMSWPSFRVLWFIPVIFAFFTPLILAQASNGMFNEENTGYDQ